MAVAAAFAPFVCGAKGGPAGAAPAAVAHDGEISDWLSGVTTTAHRRWLYNRIELPVAVTMQANREPHVIAVDHDADVETGRRETVHGVTHGLDLQIAFAPPTDDRDERGLPSEGPALIALVAC